METQAEKNLKSVVELYSSMRQAGHTTAVVEGAKSCGAVVVVHSERMRGYVEDMSDEYVATMSLNSLYKLRGVSKSVVFDNEAVLMLAQDALEEIDRLKGVISRLKKNIQFQIDQV